MYKVGIYRRYMHIPLIIPFCLENPSPVPEPLLLTWNPSFALWCDSRPLWSQVACVPTSHPLFLPIPISLSPTVPHFKYMPSYDDITTSASHSPIQYCKSLWLFYLYMVFRGWRDLWPTRICGGLGERAWGDQGQLNPHILQPGPEKTLREKISPEPRF
jgi:hypothetical protein